MNTKLRIILVTVLVLSVTAMLGAYVKNVWPLSKAELLSTTIAVTIVLIGITAVISMMHSVKTNQPLHDEMTKKLAYKAGYYAWIATIYIALAVGWFIDDIPGMMPRHGSTAVLMLSALTYFIILGILKIRGDVE
ncbi:MAG: hypothetical protein ABH834_05850 [Candidatus Altiarchaeota archaeon]